MQYKLWTICIANWSHSGENKLRKLFSLCLSFKIKFKISREKAEATVRLGLILILHVVELFLHLYWRWRCSCQAGTLGRLRSYPHVFGLVGPRTVPGLATLCKPCCLGLQSSYQFWSKPQTFKSSSMRSVLLCHGWPQLTEEELCWYLVIVRSPGVIQPTDGLVSLWFKWLNVRLSSEPQYWLVLALLPPLDVQNEVWRTLVEHV